MGTGEQRQRAGGTRAPRMAVALLFALAASLLAGGSTAQAQSPGANARIIGGTPLAADQERFVVALLDNGRFECSGALISPTRVLTAAHCVAIGQPGPFAIIAGKDLLGDPGGEVIGVTAVAVHPGFNGKLPFNDVAVLTLERPSIYPTADLPTVEEGAAFTADGQLFTAIGFGVRNPTPFGRPGVGILRIATVKTGGGCRRFRRIFVPEAMLCTIGGFFHRRLKIRRGVCSGDSGGPLIRRLPDGRPTVFGTASYGGGALFIRCGRGPNVYTRVSAMLPFITANLGTETPPL